MYKKQIRIIGIDDSPFVRFKKGSVLVIGTIFRGGDFLDGLVSTKVTVDGNNATKKLIEMINNCKFKPQLRCILLDGIALAGFNVIDIKELSKKTKIPVIVIMRNYPNFKKITNALKKAKKLKKLDLMHKAGKITKVNNIYIQHTGLNLDKAKQIIKISCTRSNIPEPIRVAHLIASGVIKGESKGGA